MTAREAKDMSSTIRDIPEVDAAAEVRFYRDVVSGYVVTVTYRCCGVVDHYSDRSSDRTVAVECANHECPPGARDNEP